jgi:ketosteroid isomerase-like protein
MTTKTFASKISLVETLRNSANKGDFDLFKSFLKDDLILKVGATDEIRSPESAVEFFIDMNSHKIQLTGLEVKDSWEMKDVVIVEYFMKGNRVSDHKYFEFPCVDIYHFQQEKIYEWHVYPMYEAFVNK